MISIGVVIVAAGSSKRMVGVDKQNLLLKGMPVVVRAAKVFQEMGEVSEIILVTSRENISTFQGYVTEYALHKVKTVCQGGDTRQQSVFCGVGELSSHVEYIAIHDGARPFITKEVVSRCLADAIQFGAATAAVKTKDTIKIEKDGFIAATPDRDKLYLTQTPQIFRREIYIQAMEQALKTGIDVTDDCQLVENIGHQVYLSQGSYDNIKITTPEDIPTAEAISERMEAISAKEEASSAQLAQKEGATSMVRIGHGYDVHRLVEGRKLILGGVNIPWEKGLLGHSDADVLVHAVMDALLGAAALGDIGQHFPDTDPAYAGADSIELLQNVGGLLEKEGYGIGNIDCTILAQQPKLKPFIPEMRQTIADALKLSVSQVSVKATTEEGLGFTGAGDGIAAHSVCIISAKGEG